MSGLTSAPALQPIIWASISSWYYGYHLSELNFPMASLTCSRGTSTFGLSDCLPITSSRYSIVTAIFTIGGLCGSLGSSYVTQRSGLHGGILLTGYLNLAAALLMALSYSWLWLALGRFVAGLSSGVAVCLVPPYLAQVARSSPQLAGRSGLVGSMHQMGIVIGLFAAQVVGWVATGERGDIAGRWRWVVLVSGIVSVLQILRAKQVVLPSIESTPGRTFRATLESPSQAHGHIHSDEHEHEHEGDREAASETLLSNNPHATSATPHQASQQQLPLRALLSSPTLRGPSILCATILALQQLSGVNAVMFYSTPVLKPLLPASAALIGLGITGVNAAMTVPAMLLVDRVGRKRLLLFSVLWMGSMSAMLAYGLDAGHRVLSAVAIVSFIAAFSVGLGPIPFLFVSELVPQQAIPALSAFSLSFSWILNFLIALLFLPLRDALSTPNSSGGRDNEGRIFYFFMITCGILAGIVGKWLPRDK